MFADAIKTDIRSILAENCKNWKDKPIYVGGSGNFTVERVLTAQGLRDIHSNDVSLFSSAVGKYLTGEPLSVHIKAEEYQWLEDYLTDGIGTITAISMSATLFDYEVDNIYAKRMLKSYRRQWDDLFIKSKERIKKALDETKISEYCQGDLLDFIKSVPDNGVVISFPPTFSYEKLYKRVDDVFEWEKPTYKKFDEDGLKELLGEVYPKEHWLTFTNIYQPDMDVNLIGKVQTSLRSQPVYAYSSEGRPRITLQRIKTDAIAMKRFGMEDRITDNSVIKICKIQLSQLNLLRAEYLNKGIIPASASMCFAVTIDDKLFGCFALDKATLGMFDVYGMTDFPIAPLPYVRASKLILACILSKEIKAVCEQTFSTKVRTMGTTAFTKKAASMKYRGLYELQTETEGKLNYVGQAGKWSLKEGLEWWMKNHSQIKK